VRGTKPASAVVVGDIVLWRVGPHTGRHVVVAVESVANRVEIVFEASEREVALGVNRWRLLPSEEIDVEMPEVAAELVGDVIGRVLSNAIKGKS
jgi:hypothetical protein